MMDNDESFGPDAILRVVETAKKIIKNNVEKNHFFTIDQDLNDNMFITSGTK